MLEEFRIAVVVPAYNEGDHIEGCLDGIPSFVDHILVVDDASGDHTFERAEAHPDPRVRVLVHAENRGVGAAIVSGYRAAQEAGCDIAVVMAGDGQMHPDDMPGLLLPILRGRADYVKGNRLAWPGARHIIPVSRRLGIRLLEPLTRFSTGLTRLHDFQCGYTAVRLSVMNQIALEEVYPRYGFPNDLLHHLALSGVRIEERVVRPIYADERSDLRIPSVVIPILALLARGVLRRLRRRPLPTATQYPSPSSESARPRSAQRHSCPDRTRTSRPAQSGLESTG